MASYLASHPPDLPQAKFLMQRVSQSVKESEDGAKLVWATQSREFWTRLAVIEDFSFHVLIQYSSL